MVEVQQQHHSNHINNGAALRFKEQPWCGKHFNNQEQITSKNVYNYDGKNRNVEKTPMCRIAELARYHKLKHEYILLDESGPAHKKQFTVKLVLKPGEEYEGSGPSIKKAQQSAAENALLKTQLQLPPQRKPVKPKNETNPVYLLYSVANQLGLSVQFEEQIEVMPLNKTPFMTPPPIPYQSNDNRSNLFSNSTQQHKSNYFNGFNNFPTNTPPPSIIPTYNLHERNPEMVCAPPWVMGPETRSLNLQQSMNGPALLNCMPSSLHLVTRVPPPTAKLNTPPPLIPFHSSSLVPQCKCSFLLSDGSEHRGQGRNMISAKIDAALNALSHLRPLLSKMEAKLKDEQTTSDLSKKGSEQIIDTALIKQNEDKSLSGESDEDEEAVYNEVCNIMCDEQNDGQKQRRSKPKSVVSQIHECAYRLKMNVEFEIIRESGEPHNRRYMLSCTLSSPHSKEAPIVAVGEGSSKKAAKQNACQLMLEKVKGLDNDVVYLAHVIVKQTTKKVPPSIKESKRKTIIKDIKKDPQYGQHINPISRLIQVMQSRKEAEPVFRLVGERGQNRYREFVVQVTCNGLTETGVGPNKKLAKRAAAVEMLEKIGYVKPMPQPGKSLLKKKSNDSIQTQMEVGVFDPNDLLSNGVQQITRQITPDSDFKSFAIESSPTPIELPSTTLETFADVDSIIAREISQLRFSSDSMSPPIVSTEQMRVRCESEKQENEDPQPIRSQRRRVTFSNQVSSCPPPEDINYPDATIAPLKSEVVLVTKLKKRGRDSKKALTPEEKFQIASTCRLFCQLPNGRELRSGYFELGTPMSSDNEYLDFGQPSAISPIQSVSTLNDDFQPASSSSITPIDIMSPSQLPNDLVVRDAKFCLERLAKHFKFTVAYSDFPKAAEEYFSLVTIGLDKPILCHGCGASEEQAHSDAAYNAINHLTGIDEPK